MKKVLIGCLVVGLIVVAIAGALGFMVFQSVRGLTQAVRSTGEAYEAINRDIPFTAPQSNAVDAASLDRWLAVRKELMPAVKEFKAAMEGPKQRNPLKALARISEQSQQVVTVHAVALRARKMSANEYFWISRRVETVLFGGDAQKDPDFKALAEEQRKLVGAIQANGRPGPGGPGPRTGTLEAMAIRDMTAEETLTILAALKTRKPALRETNNLAMLDAIGWSFSQATARERTRAGQAGARANDVATSRTAAIPVMPGKAPKSASAIAPKKTPTPTATPVPSNRKPKTVGAIRGGALTFARA